MVKLSQATFSHVESLFRTGDIDQAVQLLENDCADNLPFSEDTSPTELERVRFAALKVSGGDLERLVDAISLAQLDWRDLLVSAGFADDVHAHESWSP